MDASLYQAGVIALVTCTTKQLSFWQLLIHKKRFPLQIESLDGILIEKHSFYAFKAKQIKVGDYSCMLLITSKKMLQFRPRVQNMHVLTHVSPHIHYAPKCMCWLLSVAMRSSHSLR